MFHYWLSVEESLCYLSPTLPQLNVASEKLWELLFEFHDYLPGVLLRYQCHSFLKSL